MRVASRYAMSRRRRLNTLTQTCLSVRSPILRWHKRNFYAVPDSGAECCDERVYISVCLSVYPELHVWAEIFVPVTHVRSSVLLWRLCVIHYILPVLLTSNDVILAHNEPLFGISIDTAAASDVIASPCACYSLVPLVSYSLRCVLD